jgi:hypothetical protein
MLATTSEALIEEYSSRKTPAISAEEEVRAREMTTGEEF